MIAVKRIASMEPVRRMAWNIEGMFRLLTLLCYKDKGLLHHTIRAARRYNLQSTPMATHDHSPSLISGRCRIRSHSSDIGLHICLAHTLLFSVASPFLFSFFSSTAAQEHCAPRQGWQQENAGVQNTPVHSLVCYLYYYFFSSFLHGFILAIFWVILSCLPCCFASYLGRIPKTCNYAYSYLSN